MKFEIRNRWSGEVQFTAEIEATDDTPLSVKIGLAVKWGIKEKANLRDANLRRAYLRDADLRGANLRGAHLRDADLRGADLRDANLRGANLRDADFRGADLRDAHLYGAKGLRIFQADLWMTLTQNRHEVIGLIEAMRAGKINGSQYEGECACLVGTIANVRGCNYLSLTHNADNPAERWFAMIRPGDKPGDDTPGGFAITKAYEWTLEWCALNGVEVPSPTEAENQSETVAS